AKFRSIASSQSRVLSGRAHLALARLDQEIRIVSIEAQPAPSFVRGAALRFCASHRCSRFQCADLLGDRRLLLERLACLAEPIACVGLVAFHQMNDAMRPACKRRLLVLLYDLVRTAPVACLEMADNLV